jgi:hypothetical protein
VRTTSSKLGASNASIAGGGRKEITDALDDFRGASFIVAGGLGELIYVWRAHLPAARGSAGRTADSADFRPQTRGVRATAAGDIASE